MDKCYDQYKLAWMQNGLLHSSMHPTLAEARTAEQHVSSPRMIMRLEQTDDQGHYAWKLMPGGWAWAVNYWWVIALVVVAAVVVTIKMK